MSGVFVSGQTATIWGPGENYEITYLHSGTYAVNNTNKISFENEPSAEFTISNITNDGYDYVYIGYNSLSDKGSITMQQLNFGIVSIVLPTGGLPFVLPLAYGSQDDYLVSFSEQIDALSGFGQAADQGGLFNANSSTDDEYMYLEFKIESNSSISGDTDAFVDLPDLRPEEFEGANVTYVNSTFFGSISYKLSTGVLFELDFDLTADALLVDNVDQGSLVNSQFLEFVAIVPPATFIDDLAIESVFILFSILFLIPVRRKIRDLARN